MAGMDTVRFYQQACCAVKLIGWHHMSGGSLWRINIRFVLSDRRNQDILVHNVIVDEEQSLSYLFTVPSRRVV